MKFEKNTCETCKDVLYCSDLPECSAYCKDNDQWRATDWFEEIARLTNENSLLRKKNRKVMRNSQEAYRRFKKEKERLESRLEGKHDERESLKTEISNAFIWPKKPGDNEEVTEYGSIVQDGEVDEIYEFAEDEKAVPNNPDNKAEDVGEVMARLCALQSKEIADLQVKLGEVKTYATWLRDPPAFQDQSMKTTMHWNAVEQLKKMFEEGTVQDEKEENIGE